MMDDDDFDTRNVTKVLQGYKDQVAKLQGGDQHEKNVQEKRASVNVSTEYMALDGADGEGVVRDPHRDAVLTELSKRKRGRQLTVPTDVSEVKMMLRKLGFPICLFGEDKGDRRERLRALLCDVDEETAQAVLHKEEPVSKRNDETETWYHKGPDSLQTARIFIAKYSLPRAKQRLEKAREEQANLTEQTRALRRQEIHRWVRDVTNYGSQVGDVRPISYCEFSPDSQLIATSSWSGVCKVWSVPNCQQQQVLRGHEAAAGCIRWHPAATLSLTETEVNLASVGHDGSVLLWDRVSDEPVAELAGHAPHRVSRCAFHPSGRFLATCCHDNSWRLFDMEQNEEVLFQEGHSRPVFDISFHSDGSVALTGGMDAFGRVWDLRTGRCIMFLEGHQNHVVSTAFAPNGFHMATGSADNSVKIWDLRMRRSVYTLPAHKSLVAKVKYLEPDGGFLITASYDCKIKIWTNPGWQQLKELAGHDSKVMCVDVSSDKRWIASSGFDRTFKLWGGNVDD